MSSGVNTTRAMEYDDQEATVAKIAIARATERGVRASHFRTQCVETRAENPTLARAMVRYVELFNDNDQARDGTCVAYVYTDYHHMCEGGHGGAIRAARLMQRLGLVTIVRDHEGNVTHRCAVQPNWKMHAST
jgi:hypothetical protein